MMQHHDESSTISCAVSAMLRYTLYSPEVCEHAVSAQLDNTFSPCKSSLPIPFHNTTANALAACSRCRLPFFNSANSPCVVRCASLRPRQTLCIFLTATSSFLSRSLACRSALARAMTLSGDAAPELLPRFIVRWGRDPEKWVNSDISPGRCYDESAYTLCLFPT